MLVMTGMGMGRLAKVVEGMRRLTVKDEVGGIIPTPIHSAEKENEIWTKTEAEAALFLPQGTRAIEKDGRISRRGQRRRKPRGR